MDYERRYSWWAGLARGLVALLIAAPGCLVVSEPTSDTGSEPTSDSGSEPTSDTGSEPTSDTGSDASASSVGSETGATDTGDPVEAPWSDVPCGFGRAMVMCVGNEVCVQPGADCDFSPCRQGEEALLITHPPECQPFPAHCDPADPEPCIIDEYCETQEIFSFADGFLSCAGAYDCYCD